MPISIESSRKRPVLTILAGPNGAGKTYLSGFFEKIFFNNKSVVNIDALVDQVDPNLLPYDPLRYQKVLLKEVDKVFRSLVETAIEKREDFVFECNLRTDQLSCVKHFEEADYLLNLVYIWLDSIDISKERVATRVNEGGHLVGEKSIRCNFEEGLQNLDFSVSNNHWHHVFLIDGSKAATAEGDFISLLLEMENGVAKIISDKFFSPERELYLPNICKILKDFIVTGAI